MSESAAFYDYAWYGSPDDVTAYVAGRPNVVLSEPLDGLLYFTIRSTVPLELPAGLLPIGPNLSARLLGLWQGAAGDVPSMVTRFQAREALRQMPGATEGRSLFDEVDDYARTTGGTVLAAWNEALHFYRDSPLILALAAIFLPDSGAETSAQRVDALFRLAATISA